MTSVLNFGEIAEGESVDMAHRIEGVGDYAGMFGYLLGLEPYEAAKVFWDDAEGVSVVPQQVFRIA